MDSDTEGLQIDFDSAQGLCIELCDIRDLEAVTVDVVDEDGIVFENTDIGERVVQNERDTACGRIDIPVGIAELFFHTGDADDLGSEVTAVKLFVQKCLCFSGKICHAADHADLLAAALLFGVGFTDGDEFLRVGDGEAAYRNDTLEFLDSTVGTGQLQGYESGGAALEVRIISGDIDGDTGILKNFIGGGSKGSKGGKL